jgi:hypothetical protein
MEDCGAKGRKTALGKSKSTEITVVIYQYSQLPTAPKEVILRGCSKVMVKYHPSYLSCSHTYPYISPDN